MQWVILDRDGVLNHDSDEYVKSPAEFRPIEGSAEAVARLCRAGLPVAVVTNQSGLARGLFDRRTLDAIHAKLARELARAGARLAGLWVCPHHPDEGCACRKPRTGLLEAAARALDLPLSEAAFVGDSRADLEAARAAGCRPVLVETGKGRRTLASGVDLEGVTVCADLADAVDRLLEDLG